MPTAKERRRGGVIRYRTISLPGGKYLHVGVTRKKGPRGGRTLAGPVHSKKGMDFVSLNFANRDAPDKLLNTGVGKKRLNKKAPRDLYGIKGTGKMLEDLHL